MTNYPARFDTKVDSPDEIPAPVGTLACAWGDPQSCADDNTLRAEFAGVAVKAFAARVGGLHGESAETIIGDLLNNLRHLCDALDLDFDGLVENDTNYAAELRGEF